MFLSVGIEIPHNTDSAYGLVVPALCNEQFACFSAADQPGDIPEMAREAILLVVEQMLASGKYTLADIDDRGCHYYGGLENYQDFTQWVYIDVDLTQFAGKPHRINITLPDILIQRIDNRVKYDHHYRDRSHFLAEAARRELAG